MYVLIIIKTLHCYLIPCPTGLVILTSSTVNYLPHDDILA